MYSVHTALQKKHSGSKIDPPNMDLLNSFNKKLKNAKWSVDLDDELNELLTKLQSCNISKNLSSDNELNELANKMQLCNITGELLSGGKTTGCNGPSGKTTGCSGPSGKLNNNFIISTPVTINDKSNSDSNNNFFSYQKINKKKILKNDTEFDFISQYPIDITESKRISEFKVDITADLKLIVRKLLVFDLDGTFFYNKSRSKRPGSHLVGEINARYLEGSFRERNYYVYPRKGALEFLHFLLYEYKNSAIWTSMQEINAHPIIEHMVGKDGMSLFKFIWCRTECQKNIKDGKWAIEKPINKIINDKRINPDRSLKHTDVKIYDDNPKKIQLNDPNTIKIIPTFDATKSDNDDDFLFTLMNDIKNGNFDLDYMAKYNSRAPIYEKW